MTPVLPRLLLLTDRTQVPHGRLLAEVVGDAIGAGVRAVVLRERDLDDGDRLRLAEDLQARLEPVAGVLVVAAPRLGRPTGVHLRRGDPVPHPRPSLLGRSCHDARELSRAAGQRCDYVTLSPVAPSASKTGYGPALGRDGLAQLTRRHRESSGASPASPLVYALGGVAPDNAHHWLEAGADGVAVMGALMRAQDPAGATARLLDATRLEGTP